MKKVKRIFSIMVILSYVLLNVKQIEGYNLTITSSGSKVNFGNLTPVDSPYIIPYAKQIVVVSTSGNWSLSVQATDNLIKTSGIPKSIPISQLQFAQRSSTSPVWTPFSITPQVIASGGTTTSEGIIINYDYMLEVNWTNYPGTYRGTITYSVTGGFLESSFSQPNPFSPNGDGVKDTTTIYYYLDTNDTITVTIRDVNDVVIKTLLNSVPQTAGKQSVSWDGTDDSGIVVPSNDYKYLIQNINYVTLGSGIITVDIGTSTGTATVLGKVKDARNFNPIANAVISIYERSGNFVGSTTSNSTGDYIFSDLPTGYYYLTAKATHYYPKTSTVFLLSPKQILTKDIYLDHNISLLVIKQANVKNVQVGDIITYTIKIRNIGRGKITQVKIVDKLPYNFKYMRETSRLNSHKINDPNNSENSFIWEIGDFLINEEKILTYKVLVGIDAEVGDQKNSAEIFGIDEKGEEIITLVSATVRVKEKTFRNYGVIIGKVYKDINSDGIQQKGETGIANVSIIMENGLSAITDEEGRYSIPQVKPGWHLLMIDTNTLPAGYFLNVNEPQFVNLPPGGTAKLDFGVLYSIDKKQTFTTQSATSTDRPVFIGLAKIEIEEDAIDGDIEAFHNKYGDSARYRGCLAFYLKTKIKDKYQLTTSLDTRKTRKDKFLSPVNPEDYYPIYGDNSKTVNKTPSSDPIFLHLQSNDLDLLYGDYLVELKENRLSSYNRNITGAKVEREIARSKLTIFGASTRQVSARDDIPGKGICGPYYLTHYPIVDGSERIRIEVRDAKNLHVISTKSKERNKDYSLDYETGKLIFEKPIPKGGKVIHYIVVFYEYIPIGPKHKYILYGLRGVTIPHKSLKLATTYIKEKQSPTDYHLFGIDASFSPVRTFTINSEYAKTDGDLKLLLNQKDNNSAYLVETLSSHSNDKYKLKTFYHQVGANFSNKIEVTTDKERDDFNQYGPEFYDITNLTPKKDIREYGLRVDCKLRGGKASYFQKKISTENISTNAQKNRIFGFGFTQKINKSTFFANFKEENKMRNQIRESRKQIFTVGKRGTTHRHTFGLKYSLTDFDNFINRNLNTITHDLSLKLKSKYDRISPFIEYELSNEMRHGKHLLRTHNLTTGASTKLFPTILLDTSYSCNWKYDYVKGTKTKTIASNVKVNYNPNPKINLSTTRANRSGKEIGTDKIIDLTTKSFKIDLIPTDKTKLSAKREIKSELDKEDIISGDVEFKQKVTERLDTSLKYSYSKDKNTGDFTTLLTADLKQKFLNGLTTYGKYSYERSKKRNKEGKTHPSFESKLSLALAYRPPHTNKLNLLSKCELSNKSAIISLESIYVPTDKWSLFGKYAMRKIEIEDITSYIDLIIGRATYNINKISDVTAGYSILHQRLTGDYRMNPFLELGLRFDSHFRFVLGYNFIEYKNDEIFDDGYSARGPYLKIVGRFWQSEE